MKHTIKLTNGAALLLHNLVSQSGWAAGIDDIVHGGAIVVDILGTIEPKLSATDKGALDKEWMDASKDYEFTEKQRDSAKRCIQKSVDKVVPGKPILNLLTAFGLAGD